MSPRSQPPVVGVFRHRWLPSSEVFIAEQVDGLRRWQPRAYGREAGPLQQGLPPLSVIQASGQRRFFLRTLYTLTGRSRLLLRAMRDDAVRLLHAHFGPDGLYASHFARALGVPLLVTFHGFDATQRRRSLLASGKPSSMRYALFGQSLAGRADLALAVSAFIRERLIARGWPAHKVRVHHLGLDLARLPAAAAEPDRPVVICVGRAVQVKGWDRLLRAFAALPRAHREARLFFVGDGPERRPCERLATELRLGARVKFLGTLPHEQTLDQIARSTLLCQPSLEPTDGRREGLGMTLVEAAACARPLLASRSGGIPEIARDGRNALLTPPGDVRALSQGLRRLLDDAELRLRLGRSGRALVEAEFDRRRQCALLEDIYDGLAGGHAAGHDQARGG